MSKHIRNEKKKTSTFTKPSAPPRPLSSYFAYCHTPPRAYSPVTFSSVPLIIVHTHSVSFADRCTRYTKKGPNIITTQVRTPSLYTSLRACLLVAETEKEIENINIQKRTEEREKNVQACTHYTICIYDGIIIIIISNKQFVYPQHFNVQSASCSVRTCCLLHQHPTHCPLSLSVCVRQKKPMVSESVDGPAARPPSLRLNRQPQQANSRVGRVESVESVKTREIMRRSVRASWSVAFLASYIIDTPPAPPHALLFLWWWWWCV